MPLKIAREKRHHLGEEDLNHPAIFCDRCGEQVTDHRTAQVYWMPEDGYGPRDAMFFHGDCCRAAERDGSIPGRPFFMSLPNFVRYLAMRVGCYPLPEEGTR